MPIVTKTILRSINFNHKLNLNNHKALNHIRNIITRIKGMINLNIGEKIRT